MGGCKPNKQKVDVSIKLRSYLTFCELSSTLIAERRNLSHFFVLVLYSNAVKRKGVYSSTGLPR